MLRITWAIIIGVLALGASAAPKAAAPQNFEAHIAPLLSRHCLECHDSGAKKGRLDLSRKEGALAGGKKGRAIVPGKSKESLVWELVESDEMPADDRPPLSADEKRLLREWIDAGAVWSGEAIDPLTHLRDRRTAEQNWLRRLTVPEYVETLRSAVGVDIEPDARRILPPDLRADGFHNTAYNLNIDLAHVEGYARLAEIVVGRMDVAKFAARFSKRRELKDVAMRELIARMGKWLLRGPLEEQEVAAFLNVSKAVEKQGGDYGEAVRCVVEAMLQSPRFVYRIERQRGDGSPQRVGDYELASRLSYIVWGGPPDEELMRAAEAGELSDKARVASQVRRMLEDPRAVKRSLRFVHEWLDLDRLENMRPATDRFPKWDERLAADMREETLKFFEEVSWKQRRPLSELLNAKVTFVTPRLAEHYGLRRERATPVPTGAKGGGLLALYRFDEGKGDIVRDTSGAGEPLNLKIESTSAVAWESGGLKVKDATVISSSKPPNRLIDAVKKSKAVTLEAWVTPGDAKQTGPARIVTLSSGVGARNFTLGQDGDKFDVRFRAKGSDANGLPSVASPGGVAGTRATHVVYTRDAAGKAKIYVDGEQKGSRDVTGDLSNWDDGFALALANETTKDRPWRGTFHLVAIYGRALTAQEVRAAARPGSGSSRYDLASVPARGGLLTQGSVLTVGGDDASMVARGLFVLKDLLYSGVGNPPPGTDTTPVPPKKGMSHRAIAETRLANNACAGCHSKFEPLAFGLEKFDGVGAYHEKDEHGNKLREDGEILFPGTDKPVRYKTTAELMDLLAGSERVRMNMTRKVAQFALGRPLVASDEAALQQVHAMSQSTGGTYASVVSAIVMSDLVQMTQTETGP